MCLTPSRNAKEHSLAVSCGVLLFSREFAIFSSGFAGWAIWTSRMRSMYLACFAKNIGRSLQNFSPSGKCKDPRHLVVLVKRESALRGELANVKNNKQEV